MAQALRDCRGAFWSVAIFSGLVNLLMLAGPLYMLQVYDRVLASRSVPTLIALSVLLAVAYGFQAILDLIRTRIVTRSAAVLDKDLGTTVHNAVLRLATNSRSIDAQQPVRDLDQIRSFLTSAGPIAIVDLPWMPVFLAICFLLHPWIGFLSLFGALLLVATTLLTERSSREPAREVAKGAGQRAAAIEADRRNSETITAMGLGDAMAKRWNEANNAYLTAVRRSSDVVSSYGGLSKVLRLFLQSGILGLGAYLVIQQQLSPGSMIAASIMMARALAPIETAIANWRGFVAARDATHRLSQMLAHFGISPERMELPPPKQSFEAEDVVVVAPETQVPIVGGVRFQTRAGDVVGVIGPSGSGKTSLIRVLVGIWPPARGAVRIDGAELKQWSPTLLGPHIGYLSQAVELFDGTVAQNIARMANDPDPDKVVKAARAAGAHDMILHLRNGYDTRIGDSGAILSAGQRQRVALARALYNDPFLIVLDEPNANLDSDGEEALLTAIEQAAKRGAIVLMIAHRRGALKVCNRVLVLRDGAQMAFGPRDEVLARLMPQQPQQPPQQAPATAPTTLKVVSDNPGSGA
ncbi:ATP-binding cassette subfamily C protein [Variibacter gotjawalensis]|uniref:type I secretion system permease/ATPase n=1 Tax=Variibacter gotjawalensis TaxID=1333996 RepID=UPI0010E4E9D8|nr:ATP-binding cassette subfamily C protein [Variibacter gotjawalensis]RZS49094.1 PrtD family type I secretion system ABC transporter [Variibacter gotjawalensis]